MYTTTVRAAMFATLYPLMLVFYFRYTGVSLSRVEWVGVMIAVGGIIVATMLSSSNSNDIGLKPTMTIFGDSLCLLSAVCETLVILNRQKTLQHVPLMQYTTATTLVVTVLSSIFFFIASSITSIGSGNEMKFQIFCFENTCLLGWFSTFWVLKMLAFGLLVGVFCIGGFNYAVRLSY
jgi:drug/metabolite transporter (DMT)-like permease